jgi:hypothetical protein
MTTRHRAVTRLTILALAAAGFALTLIVFYPGVMTYDARYVYDGVTGGVVGDWQSPLMVTLWRWVDPLAPGPGSLLLLTSALYWSGFALVGLTLAPRAPVLAIATPLLGLAPPAFILLGVIWRDVLFAATWLFAAALAFVTGGRGTFWWTARLTALALIAAGVLLRPNALVAAPVLAVYALAPARLSWKRVAIAYVPLVLLAYGLIQFVYYGVLDAKRQNPLHSLLVFDLGGITHFSGENQFPVTWSAAQERMLTEGCYDPSIWDVYWFREPCRFVMDRLDRTEGEKLFGTSAIPQAWLRAVTRHPLAYLQHRAAHFRAFATGENLVVWFRALDDGTREIFPDRPAFQTLKRVHDALKPTPLLRTWPWLVLCLGLVAATWRRRADPAGAYAAAAGAAAALYVGSFAVFGVASDFRYGYWAVLAGLSGAAAALATASPRPLEAT